MQSLVYGSMENCHYGNVNLDSLEEHHNKDKEDQQRTK